MASVFLLHFTPVLCSCPSLFPTMPRHNYWRAAPHVQALCDKYGVKYQEKSLYEAFADIIRYDTHLKSHGFTFRISFCSKLFLYNMKQHWQPIEPSVVVGVDLAHTWFFKSLEILLNLFIFSWKLVMNKIKVMNVHAKFGHRRILERLHTFCCDFVFWVLLTHIGFPAICQKLTFWKTLKSRVKNQRNSYCSLSNTKILNTWELKTFVT